MLRSLRPALQQVSYVLFFVCSKINVILAGISLNVYRCSHLPMKMQTHFQIAWLHFFLVAEMQWNRINTDCISFTKIQVIAIQRGRRHMEGQWRRQDSKQSACTRYGRSQRYWTGGRLHSKVCINLTKLHNCMYKLIVQITVKSHVY